MKFSIKNFFSKCDQIRDLPFEYVHNHKWMLLFRESLSLFYFLKIMKYNFIKKIDFWTWALIYGEANRKGG